MDTSKKWQDKKRPESELTTENQTKLLICAICAKEFKTSGNMNKHIRASHTDIKPFKCSSCNSSFKTNSCLNQHSIRNHTAPIPCDQCNRIVNDMKRHKNEVHNTFTDQYKCNMCQKKFRRKGYLKSHMSVHKSQTYNCNKCPKVFSHEQSLKKHTNIYHANQRKENICKMCCQNFQFPTQLLLHEEITHSSQIFSCTICAKELTNKPYLYNHMRISHKQGKIKVPCTYPDCLAVFEFQSNLKVHMIKHSTKKLYKCKDCDKKFKRSHSMKRHQLVHSGERNHKCSVCPFVTHDPVILKRHVLGHTGEKPHKCESCQKTFMLLSSRNSHYKQVHLKIKSFKCGLCDDFAFSSKKDLSRHQRTHGDVPLAKPFSCERPVCKKTFAKLSSLKQHERSHTGEKTHKCDVCQKKLACKRSLDFHKRTHTGEKPYACKYCQESFSQSGNFYRHVRTTHTGETPFLCDFCEQAFNTGTHLKKHQLSHKEKSLHM